MKNLFLYLLLFSVSIISNASETTFADIQKRVAKRNKITEAILAIDKRLRFKLTVNGNKAEVKIWKSMKVKDPNMEKYTFKLIAEIQQEYERLKLQKELQVLISKCSLLERRYRVANYKKHKVYFNMPYKDAIKVLRDDFKDSGPRAWFGSIGLESAEYIIEFRFFKLYDIKRKLNFRVKNEKKHNY